MLAHFQGDAARWGGLRLDAEPADARPARGAEVGQPLARARVPRRGVPRAVRGGVRPVELFGLFHARKLRVHELALRAAGTRARPRSGSPSRSTTASRRPSRRATSRSAPARSTARSTSSRCCAVSGAAARALALVLHSHMPYVEGFGTWPFGEEWLWEAVACVYLPLLELLDGAPVTVGPDPGAVRPARGDAGRGGRALPALPARDPAPDPRRGRAGLERAARHDAGRRGRRAAATTRGPSEPSRRAAATSSAPSRALDRVELWTSSATHARAAAAGHRRRAAAAGRHRRRLAPRALRRVGRRLLAARVRLRPGLERDLADHGVRAFCVDQTAVPGFDHLPAGGHRGRPGRRPDRLARRSSWSGTTASGLPGRRHLPRLPPPHGPRPQAVEQRRRPLRPRGGRRAGARARARLRGARRGRVAGGGLLCCALDTELLGHWWYEGPVWLAAVLDEAPRQGLAW